MSEQLQPAKPRFSLTLILTIVGVAVGLAIFWSKGYIDLNSVKGLFAFIFILGAAVVIHEFGHFAVAKMLKIRVETFSVGFGPRLFGRKWGTTDYRLSAIPLGGYVKLGGDETNAAIEGEGDSDIPPEEQFNLRPRWQRVLVAVAGPVMNVLTALAIPFIAGLLWGVPVTPTSPVVSRVAPDSAAQIAGLQKGDRIVSYNGTENPAWDDIRGDALVIEDQPQPRPLVVERNGQRLSLAIVPKAYREGDEVIGKLGIVPDYGTLPVMLRSIMQGGAASKAGLQPGDRLVALNGEPVRNTEQAMQYISEYTESQIRVTVERQGQQLELQSGVDRIQVTEGKAVGGLGAGIGEVMQMELQSGTDRILSTEGKTVGRLGVGLDEVLPFEHVGVVGTFAYAARFNWQIMKLTGKALGQLFKGQRSARNTISGPIGIYSAASTAANEGGWAGVFTMLGFLSLSLGVFNLLPIPVLDGGAIFLLLIEAVLSWVGIKLSMTMRERIQQVGFVMLLLLMGFVITNDVLKKASSRSNANEEKPAATAPQK